MKFMKNLEKMLSLKIFERIYKIEKFSKILKNRKILKKWDLNKILIEEWSLKNAKIRKKVGMRKFGILQLNQEIVQFRKLFWPLKGSGFFLCHQV